MRYVLNKCHGGFGLSNEAFEWLIEEKSWVVTENANKKQNAKILRNKVGDETNYYSLDDDDLSFRCHPDIVECVEKLGETANGLFAKLVIVDCPLGPDENIIEIDSYDGFETLQTIPSRW